MIDKPVQTAVVTGGHAYDVPNLHRLFRELDGVDAYVQSVDDFYSSPREVRERYDAVVFYTMMLETPRDDGLAWRQGKPLTALTELGETRQGIVLLHHGILAYPGWPLWRQVSGAAGRIAEYHIGEQVAIEIAGDHEITRGLSPWTMIDETYLMPDIDSSSHALLACGHAKSMKTIAWTRGYKRSRIFCFQSGHDNRTWSDESFRSVLRRGILWSAATR